MKISVIALIQGWRLAEEVQTDTLVRCPDALLLRHTVDVWNGKHFPKSHRPLSIPFAILAKRN